MAEPMLELMAQVRAALLDGDLAALPDLIERIDLAPLRAGEDEARELRQIAAANSALIAAAIRGAQAARRRTEAILQANEPRTYGADGRIEHIVTNARPLRRS